MRRGAGRVKQNDEWVGGVIDRIAVIDRRETGSFFDNSYSS